jgi:hypothetical protein
MQKNSNGEYGNAESLKWIRLTDTSTYVFPDSNRNFG